MIKDVAHIGIAVRNLEAAVSLFRDVFQMEMGQITELKERGVRIAIVKVGNTRLELLSPMGENSELTKFLEKRGEGIHHLTFVVDNLGEAIENLRRKGVVLVDETPRQGLEGPVVFLHPKSTHGVLIELCQYPSEGR